MLFHCILAFMVYVEKKAVNLMGRGFPYKPQVISFLLPSRFSPYFDFLHFYYDASFVDILELILLRITEFPDVFRLAFFSHHCRGGPGWETRLPPHGTTWGLLIWASPAPRKSEMRMYTHTEVPEEFAHLSQRELQRLGFCD